MYAAITAAERGHNVTLLEKEERLCSERCRWRERNVICSDGPEKRFFADEIDRKLKHTKMGTVAMANKKENMNGSQFYITLRDNISYLDKKHTIFGQVVEGLEVLEKINDVSSFFPINRVELLQRQVPSLRRHPNSPHRHSG